MTDRHAGYIVTLGEDVREDDAAAIITALRMVKGVVSVSPFVSDFELAIAQRRVDDQWRQRIHAMLEAQRKGHAGA